MRRRGNLGFDGKQLGEPFGSACGLRELGPDVGNLAEAAGGEHSIEDKLAECARSDPACDHVLRADPQNNDDTGEHQKDHDRDQQCAGANGEQRRCVGMLDRRAVALARHFLIRIGLQRAHRAHQLAGVRRRFGERILRYP